MAIVCFLLAFVLGVGVNLYDARNPSTRNYMPLILSPWIVYFAWNGIRGYRSEEYGLLIANLFMVALLVTLSKTLLNGNKTEKDLLPPLSGKGWAREAWRRYRRGRSERTKTSRLLRPGFHLFSSFCLFAFAAWGGAYYLYVHGHGDVYSHWFVPIGLTFMATLAINEWVQLGRLRRDTKTTGTEHD